MMAQTPAAENVLLIKDLTHTASQFSGELLLLYIPHKIELHIFHHIYSFEFRIYIASSLEQP